MELIKKIDKESKKQIIRFICSGILAVLTDLLVYYLLINFISYSLAKGIAFLSGTAVAYLLNKYWTFKQPVFSTTQLIKFLALYLFSLVINVAINNYTLKEFKITILAFLIATGTSTIINFVGQKFWVFKNK